MPDSHAHQVPYTPHSIRLALENTARPIADADALVAGHGLLQCVRAFEWCQAHGSLAGVRLVAELPRRANARGLYLRDPDESTQVYETDVRVRVHLPDDAPGTAKVALELRLALSCSAGWVHVPQQLLLLNGERSFGIRVDGTALPMGEVHFAELVGVDVARPHAGPVLRLPITVVRPVPAPAPDSTLVKEAALQPGKAARLFICPPEGAVSAELRVRALSVDTQRRVVVHILQLPALTSLKYVELEKYLQLAAGDEELLAFRVQPALTLEVCVAQFWSSLGPCTLQYSLEFRGLCASNMASYHLAAPSDAVRVDVR